jgi:hypothetical protein
VLLREIIDVSRENHKGHTNGLRGETAQVLVVQLMVHEDPAAWCIFMVSVSTVAVCAKQLPIGGKAKRR